jgi:DNA-binding transcriptional LysR family regulator
MAKISEAPFYIAIRDDHRLASRETLTLEDLRDCTWIVFDRKVHPILHDMILRRAKEEGVRYENNQNVLSAEEAFQLVGENIGIAFLPMASALRTNRPSVTVRPLVDKELRIELFMVSRADDRSKVASEFVRAFRTRIEPIIAPPQMTLPLDDTPVSPSETPTAKHVPRSDSGAGGNPDPRRVRSRKPQS